MNSPAEKPFLSSHSVYLRPINESDVTSGLWHQWYNDYELTRYNSHGVFPINQDDQLSYFRDNQSNASNISLAICDVSDDSLIGNCSLTNIDLLNRKAEITCTIGVNNSQTAGLEAIGIMVGHGFERLCLNRIYGGAHEGLEQWIKMMAALGFEQEGIFRGDIHRNNNFFDTLRFGLLNDKYRALLKERDGRYLFNSAGELYKEALRQLKPAKN